MWKKDDMPEPATTPRPETSPVSDRVAPVRTATGERATIGRSITIRGEVTGDEDLLIQGRVEGSVNLKQHSVTVGREGEVKADITARVLTVEGSVEGNLTADEQVILRSSALVEGDIVAPRVVLEDGARFRGGVDMGDTLERSGRTAAAPVQARVPEASRTAPASVEVSPRVGTGTSAGEDKGAASGKKEPQTAAQVTR